MCFWWYNTIRTITKIFLFHQIFSLYLHTNKIQIMYNVSLHNILQLASRRPQVNLVHSKPGKAKPFFLSFQTVYKNFFLTSLYLSIILIHLINLSAFIGLISVICVLFYFNGTLITHMVMIRYDLIIGDYHSNQRVLCVLLLKNIVYPLT